MSRSSIAWDELVTAATVGTGTRVLPHTGFHPTTVTRPSAAEAAGETGDATADDAGRLLELAAMETAADAVTVQPTPANPLEPAPVESRRAMSDRLAELLLLTTRTDRDVAGDLFAAVTDAGLVVPPAAVPSFLELGADVRLAPLLADVVGERGRWLARLDEDWIALLPTTSRSTELAALRRVDPAAARNELTADWAHASADDRLLLLDTLEPGLALDDVPFLEAALSDRSTAVAVRAGSLLALLCSRVPLSELPPFGQRAVDRARPAVRLVRHGLFRSSALEVVAPDRLDPMARSDGIVEVAAVLQKGQRAWWLEQIIRRAPLAWWENAFGRTPPELVALPVVGDFAPELHGGWRAATRDQKNIPWARALLDLQDGPVDPSLVTLLPAAEQAVRVRTVLDAADPGSGEVLPLLARIEGPWPADLATAAVAHLERLLSTGLVRESTPLLRVVARRLPVRTPFLVETTQARATAEDWADQQARSVGFDHPWRRALTVLAATLSVRARVDDELRRSAP